MQLGEECRSIRIIQCGALADTHQFHLEHVQQYAAHRRIEVRQVAKGDVVDRVHRSGDPLKPGDGREP
jgi:hypothetical protein